MINKLSNLEPSLVWNLFEEISRIPRPSKKEEKIRNWVKNWCELNGIKWKEDSVGNLLLSVAAIKSCERYPGVILQAHLDMVTQKTPESTHNFDVDPIDLILDRENGFVTAKDTTLGADNGIGIAICLAAIVDPMLKHGPIEVLLTIDEETGLTGAFALKKGFFSHKYLLNLDSEDEGEITISSAGGGDSKLILPITRIEDKNPALSYLIEVSGLSGGHSGIDIDKPRMNAIKLLNKALMTIAHNGIDIRITVISGGSAHNAIPRDAQASFLISSDEQKPLEILWKEFQNIISSYTQQEPNLKVSLTQTEEKFTYIKESNILMEIINSIPHGPISMSKNIPDLVETSNNLAIIESSQQSVIIQTSTRSSVDSELRKVRKTIKDIGFTYLVKVEQGDSYPGWEPQLNSPFLNLVHQEYEKLYGKKVKLKAIHAGLECGLFKGLDPELNIVSLGPEIKDGHSPNERVYISSVALIWEVVRSTLTKMQHLNTNGDRVAFKMNNMEKEQQFSRVYKTIKEKLDESKLTPKEIYRFVVNELAELPHFHWTGIYLLDKMKNELYLEYYVGKPTEHSHIAVGVGVCGSAIAEESDKIIDDVREEDNYLACSLETRAEIVVLIEKNGNIIGQIDVDSDEVQAFDELDRKYLRKIVDLIFPSLF